jgi:hypothetical protein
MLNSNSTFEFSYIVLVVSVFTTNVLACTKPWFDSEFLQSSFCPCTMMPKLHNLISLIHSHTWPHMRGSFPNLNKCKAKLLWTSNKVHGLIMWNPFGFVLWPNRINSPKRVKDPKDIVANAALSPIHHAVFPAWCHKASNFNLCSDSCAHDSMLPPVLARIRSLGTIPMPQFGPLPWPTCITLHNVQVPFQYRSSLGVSALSTNSMGMGGETPLASPRGWPPHHLG